MTQSPAYEDAVAMLEDLGFDLVDAQSRPEHFGSWFATVERGGRTLRVVWHGRDQFMVIQEPDDLGERTEWLDRWFAGDGYPHTPADLATGLLEILAE